MKFGSPVSDDVQRPPHLFFRQNINELHPQGTSESLFEIVRESCTDVLEQNIKITVVIEFKILIQSVDGDFPALKGRGRFW